MKLYKYFLASLLMAGTAAGFTSCDDDLDYPPIEIPDSGLGGDGSAEAPFNINGIIAYYNSYYSTTPDTSTYYWVKGYIVGCVATTETVFVANDDTSQFSGTFGSASNILLAASPDCRDYNECITIQLPSGAVRTAINLKDNPGNLGRLVTIHGYIDKYLGLPGLRSADAYNWGEEGIPGLDPVVAKFSVASAITSGKAYGFVAEDNSKYYMGKGFSATASYGWMYVDEVTPTDGIIKADVSNGFAFIEGSVAGQYYITDSNGNFLYMSGAFNSFQLSKTVISGDATFLWQPVANADGTWTVTNVGNSKTIAYSVEHTSYGAYSDISPYVLPRLYEMDLDPATIPDITPDDPSDTPVQEGVIYSALGSTETEMSAGWTFENTDIGDLEAVWSWRSIGTTYYLNASAFVSSTAYAATAYAVSPVIDLAGATSCSVTFDHAAKFQTTLTTHCGFCVREEGASAWTELDIPVWPTAGSWTFANAGTIDLSAYDGKKIQVAFKYGSTTSGADTWEINNLAVSGNK